MPITESILDHDLLGPIYKKGRAEGLREGELSMLRRQIAAQFGPIPGWAEERLAGQSTDELEVLSVRVLKAQSIEDLLQ